jgi:hypothetical protein
MVAWTPVALQPRLFPVIDDGCHSIAHFPPGTVAIATAAEQFIVIRVDVANMGDDGQADGFWTQCLGGCAAADTAAVFATSVPGDLCLLPGGARGEVFTDGTGK